MLGGKLVANEHGRTGQDEGTSEARRQVLSVSVFDGTGVSCELHPVEILQNHSTSTIGCRCSTFNRTLLMSDYYELKANDLSEALAACEIYQSSRRSLVFRGQKNADWELKSGLFRNSESPKELEACFQKTIVFLNWSKQQQLLNSYSDDQLLHIAQHYGMPTDLLDFSTSLEVAAFFAIGAPQHGLLEPKLQRGALFVLDANDMERVPKLRTLPASLTEHVQRYEGAVQQCFVPGLSRVIAQDGLFVRDVGGSLESMMDPRFSLLDVAFEEEIGHSLLLKKISFLAQESDIAILAKRGCTYDRVFPPPNDLERYIVRFFDWYAAWEWEQQRPEREKDRNFVSFHLSSRVFVHPATIEKWNAKAWKDWCRLNVAIDTFVRPRSLRLKNWEVPQAEIYDPSSSPSISDYIHQARTEGSSFQSRYQLHVLSQDERRRLPVRFDIILETLMALPYSETQLELAFRMAARLFLEARPFGEVKSLMATTEGRQALERVFGAHDHWFLLDIICYQDGYSRKVMIPVEAFTNLASMKQAVHEFEQSDVGKEYGRSKSLSDGVYHLFFHRPQFRSLIAPQDAVDLWAQYVIPWQVCFGDWSAAIINPFVVEYIGHS